MLLYFFGHGIFRIKKTNYLTLKCSTCPGTTPVQKDKQKKVTTKKGASKVGEREWRLKKLYFI